MHYNPNYDESVDVKSDVNILDSEIVHVFIIDYNNFIYFHFGWNYEIVTEKCG
jgi:hypothetical protein